MYIVRWLMGRPILAAWILAAIAVLLHFTSGDKEDETIASNSETVIEESVNNEPESTKQQEEVAKTDESEKLADSSSSVKEDQSKIATSETENSKEAKVSFPPSDEVKTLTGANESQQVNENTKPPVVNETADNKNLTNVKSDTKNKDDNTISDLGELNPDEMLLMAREAYWNNGLEEAAQIYKHLIKIQPDVIEHRGELGNVFWRQGYPKQAAELYSEISIPMIEQGNSDRVANMIGFIGLFYPDRAAEIHKRLQAATNKTNN